MLNKIILIKLISIIFFFSAPLFAAGSDSDDSSKYMDNYKQAKSFILRAEKLEKKNKIDKAEKLYAQALDKLKQAYKSDRNNPDVLNYMGFTLRKTGNFQEAEKFYLMGLKIKPDHNGINEYLGELYIQTNRIELAKKRLEVLANCGCKEYNELKSLINSQ